MICDVQPGDFVELSNGRRGAVLATASIVGVVIAVEVGFEWYDVTDVVTMTRE